MIERTVDGAPERATLHPPRLVREPRGRLIKPLVHDPVVFRHGADIGGRHQHLHHDLLRAFPHESIASARGFQKKTARIARLPSVQFDSCDLRSRISNRHETATGTATCAGRFQNKGSGTPWSET